MSDLNDTNLEVALPSTTFRIPVLKAKGQFIEIDTKELPESIYLQALEKGLAALVNARMSNVGSVTKMEGKDLEAAQANAMKIANENKDRMYAGTVTKGRAKAAGGVPREIMTIARYLAKQVVNNELRAAGMKPALVKEKLKTELADDLIKSDPYYVKQATINFEEQKTTPVKVDIRSRFVADPTLVAKAEAKKAKAGTLSAKQAGMTGKVPPRRPMPQAQGFAH